MEEKPLNSGNFRLDTSSKEKMNTVEAKIYNCMEMEAARVLHASRAQTFASGEAQLVVIGENGSEKRAGFDYTCPKGKTAGCNDNEGRGVGSPNSTACKVGNYVYCY